MMLEIKKYLFDIQTSIDSINSYLGDNRDFNPPSRKACASAEASATRGRRMRRIG
jgi:hypothetical protein